MEKKNGGKQWRRNGFAALQFRSHLPGNTTNPLYVYIYRERERYLLGNYHWHCDQDFKSGIAEIELLKSNCNAEVRKREALQITCHALKQGLLLSFAISSSYFLYCFVFVRLPQRNKKSQFKHFVIFLQRISVSPNYNLNRSIILLSRCIVFWTSFTSTNE